jgi:ribosomal protein L24
MSTESTGSGLKKRQHCIPGEKVVVTSGPMEGQCGTVIEHDEADCVLIWLDRGVYARVHEVFLERIVRRW